uniref:Uncharacterized protein n=1 Tax=Anopheles albimanus TaxID=7167 RepID=A0A182FHU6_ANOAL
MPPSPPPGHVFGGGVTLQQPIAQAHQFGANPELSFRSFLSRRAAQCGGPGILCWRRSGIRWNLNVVPRKEPRREGTSKNKTRVVMASATMSSVCRRHWLSSIFQVTCRCRHGVIGHQDMIRGPCLCSRVCSSSSSSSSGNLLKLKPRSQRHIRAIVVTMRHYNDDDNDDNDNDDGRLDGVSDDGECPGATRPRSTATLARSRQEV